VKKADVIHGDRRASRRYAVDLQVQYRVSSLHEGAGYGRCADMSSSGVSFVADEPPPEGAQVEMTIQWPFLLQNVCPLHLLISGRVVRSAGKRVAVETSRYEFRARAFAEPAPQRQTRAYLM